MKKQGPLMFAACLMIISWQSGVSEEQQRPVTLTIVPIETGGWLIQGGSHPFGVTQASSIHYQIIAELVNGYECYILNRARLYNVGVEDAIRRLSSIDDSPLVGNEIPAADYIVNLLLLQDRESRCWNGKIECVNVCNPAKESVIKTTFTAETDSEIPKKAVLAIAKGLNITPKIREAAMTSTEKDAGTWAVMPFLRYDRLGSKFEDEELAQQTELSFQNHSRIKIVDHRKIDSIMAEKKISTLAGVNCVAMSSIARMAGANHLLIGCVARSKDGLRLDVQVADPRTAAVCDAKTFSCAKEEDLPKAIECGINLLIQENTDFAPIPASSVEQRHREAEHYLDTSRYVSTVGRNEISYGLEQHAMAVLENAEAAYFLCRDNPEMIYRAAEIMSNLLEYHHHFLIANYPRTVTHRAAYVANKILEPIKHTDLTHKGHKQDNGGYSGKTMVPLLLRAEALMFMKENETALKLAESHLQFYPDVQPERALWIMAKCNLALGKADKAEELRAVLGKNYTQDADYRQLTAEIAGARNDGKSIYDMVNKKMEAHEKIEKTKDWETYLDYLVKLEGPEKALPLLQKWLDGTWQSGNRHDFPDTAAISVMMSQAKCHSLMDDSKAAARRYKDVVFLSHQFKDMEPEHRRLYEASSAMISNIEAQVGQVDELWKKASEIATFPGKYAIYIVPVDDFSLKCLQCAVIEMEKYYGAKVELLPVVTIKPEIDKLPKDADQFVSRKIYFEVLMKHLQIPDNAVMVMYATGQERARKTTKSWEHSGRFSFNQGNPFVISLPWINESTTSAATENMYVSILTRNMIEVIQYIGCPNRHPNSEFPKPYKWCTNYPCVMSNINFIRCIMRPRLEMCPDCQADYKEFDFDKIHNDLMDYLKKAGAKIVKAEK